MKESEIIELLKSNPADHDRGLSYLFSYSGYKSPIIAFLRSKGLTNNDANILWTDIVIKFSLLVRKGTYEHQGKMMGYIKNLSNYMLLNYIRDHKKDKSLSLEEGLVKDPTIEAATMHHQELKGLMDNQLSVLGEPCNEVLLLWAHGYSMNEIMKKMRFVSPEATRKRKHTCMKKLLSLVNNNEPMSILLKDYYNDLVR